MSSREFILLYSMIVVCHKVTVKCVSLSHFHKKKYIKKWYINIQFKPIKQYQHKILATVFIFFNTFSPRKKGENGLFSCSTFDYLYWHVNFRFGFFFCYFSYTWIFSFITFPVALPPWSSTPPLKPPTKPETHRPFGITGGPSDLLRRDGVPRSPDCN